MVSMSEMCANRSRRGLGLWVSCCILVVIIAAGAVFWREAVDFGMETRSRIEQSSIHDGAYADYLRPTAEWVRAFLSKEGRLPSQFEIAESCPPPSGFSQVLIFIKPFKGEQWPDSGTNFVLYLHHADWNLYLNSWGSQRSGESRIWTD